MDTKKIFDGPLVLRRKFGFTFNFTEAEPLQKIFTIFAYIGMFSLLIMRLQYLLDGRYNVESRQKHFGKYWGPLENHFDIYGPGFQGFK